MSREDKNLTAGDKNIRTGRDLSQYIPNQHGGG
jgi:hypothetical protein